MTHADAFLQDILAHPDDDAPRLIFADWLEEQGDASSVARAEFIRVQCTLAAGQLPPERHDELVRRERQILNEWQEEWVRPIRRLVHDWTFHRGFVCYVAMLADTFLAHAGKLFRRAPIQDLRLRFSRYDQSIRPGEPINMAAIAENKHLNRLLRLHLGENRLESRHLRALVVSEHLTNLTSLSLWLNRIGDSGIRALAASPLLGRLEELDLCRNDFGAGGLRALAHALEKLDCSPEGLRLKRLELFPAELSAAGQRVIAESPMLRRLVRG
jgi:uncharacterized protein (TIGR02996 family)